MNEEVPAIEIRGLVTCPRDNAFTAGSASLRLDAGTATVNGFTVVTRAARVRESMRVTGQFAAVGSC